MDILERITGRRPIGYRAPAFSIVESTRWAGPILADLGFKYSSSIFPIRHRRYGIPTEEPGIHRWPDCGLIECPPASIRLLGRNWPIAGGGYFRLLPGALARSAIRMLNRRGRPAILYLHPYELDPHGVQAHKLEGERVGHLRQMTQTVFRNRMEVRLHRLFESFRFATMEELLQHAV
jgi:polysaccharide deacetylase family protein (PEP-CTERM system associated)